MHSLENNLSTFLERAEDFLRKKGIEKPRLDAQLIFSHVLELERYQLFTQFDRPLDKKEIVRLREMLVERADHKPIAYLLGYKEFFSRNFLVNSNVLIPRPETEELVEIVLDYDKEKGAGRKKLLDMGTGSGIIGLTLCLEHPESFSEIVLSDISSEALQTARLNYEKHKECGEKAKLNFIESNLFAELAPEYEASFDIIVSNPPYVTLAEYESLDDDVRKYEPRTALVVEDTDLFFQPFFQSARRFLKPQGALFVETSPSIIDQQKEIARSAGFQVQSKKDYSGKERFILLQNH